MGGFLAQIVHQNWLMFSLESDWFDDAIKIPRLWDISKISKKWKPERARLRDFQNPETLQNTKKLFPTQILMITVLYTRMCLERHQERQDQGGKNRPGTNLFRFKLLLSQLGILKVSYFQIKCCSLRFDFLTRRSKI